MKKIKVYQDYEVPSKWDVLFRCYDSQPLFDNISNEYLFEIFSNSVWVDAEQYSEFIPFKEGICRGTAKHLQGIKSIWHKLLRFLENYDSPESEIVVVFQNMFFDNYTIKYREWMDNMFEDSLRDNTYDSPKPKEEKIRLGWNLTLGDYYPGGKFKGCRIEGSKLEIPYLKWLNEKTDVQLDEKLKSLIN